MTSSCNLRIKSVLNFKRFREHSLNLFTSFFIKKSVLTINHFYIFMRNKKSCKFFRFQIFEIKRFFNICTRPIRKNHKTFEIKGFLNREDAT